MTIFYGTCSSLPARKSKKFVTKFDEKIIFLNVIQCQKNLEKNIATDGSMSKHVRGLGQKCPSLSKPNP
jgi:hypothetical protein